MATCPSCSVEIEEGAEHTCSTETPKEEAAAPAEEAATPAEASTEEKPAEEASTEAPAEEEKPAE